MLFNFANIYRLYKCLEYQIYQIRYVLRSKQKHTVIKILNSTVYKYVKNPTKIKQLCHIIKFNNKQILPCKDPPRMIQ